MINEERHRGPRCQGDPARDDPYLHKNWVCGPGSIIVSCYQCKGEQGHVNDGQRISYGTTRIRSCPER